jgi:hypothetical protein
MEMTVRWTVIPPNGRSRGRRTLWDMMVHQWSGRVSESGQSTRICTRILARLEKG